MSEPRVSVLIPVHNPGAALEPLAARILDEQTYPRDKIQLVIVDDASSDGAPDAVRRQRADDPRLIVKRAEFKQLDASRNLARAQADGELFAMTDHDCMPERDWLERAVALAGPERIVAGKVRFAAGERPTIWELLDMSYHLDQERYVAEGFAVTANILVPAATFDRLGGLDESAANAGDFEFTARASRNGVQLNYERDVIVTHPTRSTRAEYLKKMRRIGFAQGRALREMAWQKRWLMYVPGSATLARCIKRRRVTVLNDPRLAEHGIQPTAWQQTKALLVELLIVGPVLSVARWKGAHAGKAG